MNVRGLKQASRQCLQDSGISVRRLTLLFLLCFYAVSIPSDLFSFLLEFQLNHVSGLEAMLHRNRYYLYSSIILVLVNIAVVLWNAGYTWFAMQLSRGQRVGFEDFTVGFRNFGRLLVLTLLEALYVWLWSMLFIVPGLVAMYRYRMAIYVLLDHPDMSASEAINVSKRLTYGHKMDLFVLDLSFIWYYLLSGIASIPMTLYTLEVLPQGGWMNFLLPYLAAIVLSTLFDTLFRGYVQTTYAHAYNALTSMDQARWQELHNQSSPGI